MSLDESELVDHHFFVDGPTATLDGDLIEDNRNESSISVWVAKHNAYARRQAQQEIESTGPGARVTRPGGLSSPDARVRSMKRAWARLPLMVRPCLYFLYRYILRLGFLDGREGFVFHVMQGFWYRLLVDINIEELRSRPPGNASADVVHGTPEPTTSAGTGTDPSARQAAS